MAITRRRASRAQPRHKRRPRGPAAYTIAPRTLSCHRMSNSPADVSFPVALRPQARRPSGKQADADAPGGIRWTCGPSKKNSAALPWASDWLARPPRAPPLALPASGTPSLDAPRGLPPPAQTVCISPPQSIYCAESHPKAPEW